jgi:hypothetical protein
VHRSSPSPLGYFGFDITDYSCGSVKQINKLYGDYFPKLAQTGGAKEISTALDMNRIRTRVSTGIDGNVYHFNQNTLPTVNFVWVRDELLKTLREVQANPKLPTNTSVNVNQNSGKIKFGFGRYLMELSVVPGGGTMVATIHEPGEIDGARMELNSSTEPTMTIYPAQLAEQVKSKAMQLFCYALHDDMELLRNLLKLTGNLPLSAPAISAMP